jgi:hypothetical protein
MSGTAAIKTGRDWLAAGYHMPVPLPGRLPGSKDLRIHLRRTTPVAWVRLIRKITFARIVTTAVLLAGFYLLLIATFEYFQHLPYFQFFLLCVMGFAFLVITYLLKQ